jgi:hypothetical protein
LAESSEVEPLVEAVTQYVARRLLERERALAAQSLPIGDGAGRDIKAERRRWRWNAAKAFIFGLMAGIAVLFAIAWLFAPPSN